MSEKPLSLNLFEVKTVEDLAGFFGELRPDGPVVPAEPDFRAVIGYRAIREAAANPECLSSAADGVVIPPVHLPAPALPVELDPPRHRKYRRLLVPELRPDRMADWSDTIRRETDLVLNEFTENGEGDLADLARHVPSAVIAAVLGVPDDGPFMIDVTGRLMRFNALKDPDTHAAASQEMAAYLDRVVTEAEGTDRTDLLATIANAEIDGKPIGHDVAVATTMTLVMAGQDTTVHGIGSMLALFATVPGLKDALIADPGLVPDAVEEALRVESPVQVMGRTATADTEISDCPIRSGERIGLMWGAANLDPAEFEQPEQFRLGRENSDRHVAFGHGIHRCVGEHLARAEMTIVAERVLARIPDYKLAGPVERNDSNPLNRGVIRLPVTFTPSPRVL